jgi:hypothetical protein
MPKPAQKMRQKWLLLKTVGGIVFGMAGLPPASANGRQNTP